MLEAWLCWMFPMLGAISTPIFARISPKARDYAAVSFSLLGAIAAAAMIPDALAGRVHWDQVEWIPGLDIKAGVLADPLSVFLANIVAWLSFLIMVYSIGYMHGEPALTRYWFFMNLFIGNMLLLVLSDNLLQMFFGWEGVGLCSYGLIGFWYKDEPKRWVGTPPDAYPPTHAGMKAFVTTGIGDISLLIAIFIIYLYAGTLSFVELGESTTWLADLSRAGLLLPVTILFFGGPIGKSAQFPLHEWLPEAMAGPTSVSALIHAATMVKAGVYLMARIIPILLIFPFMNLDFFTMVAWIGGFTAFLAATQAMVHTEIKKVLAYSTISQIGYMMLALGVAGFIPDYSGGYMASVFHLMSHAVFKALLFMGAGSLIHACETKYMDEMGGLRKAMPITFICMLFGVLSLSGVPPLSGFWSKDAILLACLEAEQYPIFILAAITAAITFFYSLRLIGMAFLGKKSTHLEELEREGVKVHEVPRVMWMPYSILAVITVVIGFVGPYFEDGLHHFFEPIFHGHSLQASAISQAVNAASSGSSLTLMAIGTSFAMLLLGGIPAYYLYIGRRVDARKLIKEHSKLRRIRSFLWNRWYINTIYFRVFVDGVREMSLWTFEWLETRIFDRISPLIRNFMISAGKNVMKWLELGTFDRFNYALSGAVVRLVERIRKTQRGILSDNIFGIQMGLIIFLIAILIYVLLGG